MCCKFHHVITENYWTEGITGAERDKDHTPQRKAGVEKYQVSWEFFHLVCDSLQLLGLFFYLGNLFFRRVREYDSDSISCSDPNNLEPLPDPQQHCFDSMCLYRVRSSTKLFRSQNSTCQILIIKSIYTQQVSNLTTVSYITLSLRKGNLPSHPKQGMQNQIDI